MGKTILAIYPLLAVLAIASAFKGYNEIKSASLECNSTFKEYTWLQMF